MGEVSSIHIFGDFLNKILKAPTLECLINVPVRVFISRKMPPYTGLILHYTFIKFFFFVHLNILVCTYWPHNFLETQRIHPI